METIFKRRSIRKFKDTPIPKPYVEKILRAGMAAPSAGNSQEWEFILFEDPAKKEAFIEVSGFAFPIRTAPLCILICANLEKEVYKGGWWVQDCSAALENMLLEATHLGLGSIWLGVYPAEERVVKMKELFKLPDHVMPLGLMALGYADKEKPANDRYLEMQVHKETYGNIYK